MATVATVSEERHEGGPVDLEWDRVWMVRMVLARTAALLAVAVRVAALA